MIRTGIDILDMKRFEESMKSPEFLEKVFHKKELEDMEKLPGIFALKEAVMKALGQKVDWKCIEVRREGERPLIHLAEEIRPQGFKAIDGSISHDGGFILASVVLEVDEHEPQLL